MNLKKIKKKRLKDNSFFVKAQIPCREHWWFISVGKCWHKHMDRSFFFPYTYNKIKSNMIVGPVGRDNSSIDLHI